MAPTGRRLGKHDLRQEHSGWDYSRGHCDNPIRISHGCVSLHHLQTQRERRGTAKVDKLSRDTFSANDNNNWACIDCSRVARRRRYDAHGPYLSDRYGATKTGAQNRGYSFNLTKRL